MTANRTITELYQALRPLLLRDVAIAASGSRASSGGMETHALNSNWHTGQLAETQAPWAATKNEWATALATHAALPDVHHAPVTAGTLIALSGQQVGIATGANYQFVGTGSGTAAAWQNLSTLAGNGLTHSAGVLAVGAGDGLTVAADAIALTAPGTLTASTTNSASGNHTHAITSSSNPGANARILASTASGGLTLQALAVQGSVDITNNGDLTVAGSGDYAGSNVLFVDSSGGNVGIMGAPDPQFALDVVGPCRATWFVGPHAIQLKDVLLLSHFDGRQPFATNYSGEPNGHMGQVATVSGGLIYRPGKFGTKAAQFTGATANLVTNPSFETGTTGWSGTLGATLDQTTSDAYVGSYAMRITHVASTTSGASIAYSTATASTYTASAYLRSYIGSDVGYNCSILIRFTYTDASTTDTSYNHTLTDTWTRVSVTATTNGAKTLSSVTVFLRDLLSGAAHYTLVDAVQLEESSYAGSYCDGSLGSGHTWNGTAHASTSTRTAAQLTYPTAGNIHDEVGTIMAWIYVNRSAGTQTIMRIAGSSAGNIYMLITGGALAGYWGTAQVTDAGATITALTWTHVAMTYSGGTLTLYRDGVQVATGSSSGFSGMPTEINVGGYAGGNMLHGLIDDFVITESVIDADGIRAIYESDAPVFAESSRFSFRATPQGLVWADDEGLWMRNSTGGTVLGAYGGAATKSWAGLTLSPSDMVIGDSARGGYVHWDDSAQTLSVQGTITALAGSIAGVLTIGTSGEIRQGTGTLGTDYTGLRVWRDSGIGRIGGYASNTLQWYAGTDGVLYAGAGRVVLDGTGIAVQASSGTAATAQYAYRILESGANDGFEGGLYAYEGPSNVGQYIQLRAYNPGNPAYISLLAECGSNNAAAIELIAKYSTTQSRIQLSKSGDIEIDGMTYFDSPLTLDEVASTPANPSSSNRARIYVRNDNLIIQWNDGGTIRYKYMALSGTGTTWTHTTTAP